jgi:hypothetical protein
MKLLEEIMFLFAMKWYGVGDILCVYLIYCIRVNIEQTLQVHIVQATSKITSFNISPTRYVEIKIQLWQCY